MEYQKIINLLDNTPNHSSKFRPSNWVEMNDGMCGMYNRNNQIKFKTTILRSSLRDCSNVCRLVKWTH